MTREQMKVDAVAAQILKQWEENPRTSRQVLRSLFSDIEPRIFQEALELAQAMS